MVKIILARKMHAHIHTKINMHAETSLCGSPGQMFTLVACIKNTKIAGYMSMRSIGDLIAIYIVGQ